MPLTVESLPGCHPAVWSVSFESTDELREVAMLFNRPVAGLSSSHQYLRDHVALGPHPSQARGAARCPTPTRLPSPPQVIRGGLPHT